MSFSVAAAAVRLSRPHPSHRRSNRLAKAADEPTTDEAVMGVASLEMRTSAALWPVWLPKLAVAVVAVAVVVVTSPVVVTRSVVRVRTA